MNRSDKSAFDQAANGQAHGPVRARSVQACALISLVVALVIAMTGLGRDLDDSLLTIRGQWLSHPASGNVALAEIDAQTLASHARWPWPRGLHARTIDALNRAGAAQIAFDVDFSASSDPAEDAMLARAIARSHAQVILPTFRQAVSQGSSRTSENLPLPQFREHAMLAAVNSVPDSDGQVRSLLTGIVADGQPRPSMAASLAMKGGRIGEQLPLDRAIDVDSVPRISVGDLLDGKVPPGSLNGKSVLVGATAIEMGDRYPTPGRGVLPGVLLHVLAAETLLQGTAPIDHGSWPGILVVLAISVLSLRRQRLPGPLGIGTGMVVVLALPLACAAIRLGTVAVVPALAGLLTMAFVSSLLRAYEAVRIERLIDAETGLPNALALRGQVPRPAGDYVMVLRIANFADVHSAIGAGQAGRLVLRLVERLRGGLPGPIYRVEAGMLAWLSPGAGEIVEEEEALAVAAMCNLPFEIDGRAIRVVPELASAPVTAGVGEALAWAQSTAEAAHVQGRRWLRYSASAADERDWRLALAGELDAALADGSIWLAYQPKFDIRRGITASVEALVRWNHPQRGSIPPDRLIALVEDIGRIDDFTLFVLERALADMAVWQAAGCPAGVAVNVSARLPSQPGFVGEIAAVLARHPGLAEHLALEITESAVLSEAGLAVAALDELAAMGVRISIDDYGTGQSTLAYLKGLPATEIKIDKSFVQGLENSRSDQLMVQSTIQLAHGLGYKVVAEGVETPAVLALLEEYGCDVAQGWLTGRPMPLAGLLEFFTVQASREAA